MSAPDASVWTSEPPERDVWHWFEVFDFGLIADINRAVHDGERRSILPVPSAERHAALEAVAEAAQVVATATDGASVKLALKVLDAALARLETTR